MLLGLGVALLIRIAFVAANYLGISNTLQTDSHQYVQEARLVLEEGAGDFWRRPPGYPLFLIAARGVNLNLAILLQGVLGLGTCSLVYWGARRLFSESAARWAVLFVALDLTSIIYGNLILSECLFTTLLTASALCLLVSQDGKSTAVAAVLLAAGCYVRPIGLVAALLWPLLLGVVFRNRKKAVTFFSLIWLLLLPWFVRQKVNFGDFMFSGITYENPLFHNAAYVLAEIEGTPVDEVQQRLLDTVAFADWQAKGYEILLSHPFVFAYTIAKGVPVTLTSPAVGAFRNMFPSAHVVYLTGTVLACLFWLWLPCSVLALKDKAALFLFATALYLVVVPGPQGAVTVPSARCAGVGHLCGGWFAPLAVQAVGAAGAKKSRDPYTTRLGC